MNIIKKIPIKTILIVFLLIILFYLIIARFICGPLHYYDAKIANQIALIKKDRSGIDQIKRHVFKYITYCGESSTSYCWFNEKGELLCYRDKSTYQKGKVAEIAKTYNISQYELLLGYGYNNPVYIIRNDQNELLLDYDSLKEVYYSKKGELK